MKFNEKYVQFSNREQMISTIVENVYATMQLEAQPVSEQTLRTLAERIVDEASIEWVKPLQNQTL